MNIRQLRHFSWTTLVLTACGHIGLDWDSGPGAVFPGDGDGDGNAWGGELGTRPDDSGDGDAAGGNQNGDSGGSDGLGGDVPEQGTGGDGVGGLNAVGGSSSGGGDDGSGGVSSVASGGAFGSGGGDGEGATGGMNAGGTAGEGTGGSTQSVACTQPGDHHFGFDSSASFSLNGPGSGVWGIDSTYTMNSGSLSWSREEGQFALGALQALVVRPVISTNRQVLYPRTVLSRKDLRGGHLTAHLYLQSGLDAIAKIFIQSEGYLWAEGPHAELTLGAWTCLEFDVDEPVYADDDFDPSKVNGIGVEIARDEASDLTTPITVYVDDVSY